MLLNKFNFHYGLAKMFGLKHVVTYCNTLQSDCQMKYALLSFVSAKLTRNNSIEIGHSFEIIKFLRQCFVRIKL